MEDFLVAAAQPTYIRGGNLGISELSNFVCRYRAYSELPNTRADQNKQVWMEDFFIYTLMSLFKKDKSNLKKIISKKFRNFYFFSAAFYLIMCFMKAPRN